MSQTFAIVVTCIAAALLARGESLSQQNLTDAVEVCSLPSSYVNLSIYCVQPDTEPCWPCSGLCSECYGPQADQCYSCLNESGIMTSTGVLDGGLKISGNLVLNESRAIYNCGSESNGMTLSSGAIAGIAVGGAVVLVMVIVIGVCVCCCLLCRRRETFQVGHDKEEAEKERFSQTTDSHPFTNGSGPAKRNSTDLLKDLSKSPDTSNPLYLASFDASVATLPVKKAHSSTDIRESALCDTTPPYVYMEAAGTVQPGIATIKSRSLGALIDTVYSEPGQLSAFLCGQSENAGHSVSPPNNHPTTLSEPADRSKKFSTLPTSLATSHTISPDEYVDPRVFREDLDRDLEEKCLSSVPHPSSTLISRDNPGTLSTRSSTEALQATPGDFQSRKEFLGSPTEDGAAALSNEYYNIRDVTATSQENENYENIETTSNSAYLSDRNAEEEPTQDCYVEMKPGAEFSNGDDEYVEIDHNTDDGYVEMQPQFDEPKATPHGYVNLEYLNEETKQTSENGTRDKASSVTMSLSKPQSKASNTKDRIMSELYFPPAATSGAKRKNTSEATVEEAVTNGSKVEGETKATADGERTEESHTVEDDPALIYQNVTEWTSN